MFSPHHRAVFYQLLKREWYVFKGSLVDTMINSLMITSFMSLLYGYFLPSLGIEYAYRIPLFIGAMLIFVITIGYNIGMVLAQDLQSTKITMYHFALPLPYWYVLLAYVVSTALKILAVTLPLVSVGLFLIGAYSALSISIGKLALIVFLALIMNALLFLCLGIGLSFEMYLDNIWSRILAPLFTFSACFYTWGRLAQHSRPWSMVVLAGPLTYCAEGLRGAMLGGNDYISFPICVAVISGLSLFLSYCASIIIRRRLQLVLPRKTGRP